MAIFFGLVLKTNAQVQTTDSTFVENSRAIKFVVNRININEQDRKWIKEVLIPELNHLGDQGIILGRATASPEGPYPNNRRLANERRASVDALLSSYGINTHRIRYDVVAEDYALLLTLMQLKHDPWCSTVDSLNTLYANHAAKLKGALKRHQGGKLWRHVLRQYFPLLRAVRIMAIDKRLVDEVPPLQQSHTWQPLPPLPLYTADYRTDIPLRATCLPIPDSTALDTLVTDSLMTGCIPQRELLSVKTNLLLNLAYMPGYNRFCPIPNVAVEFYPLHGHFTYGASFDCPWWQHYHAHKYFQLRNYQLHTRYYLHSGDIAKRNPTQGIAFRGLYVSLYAHAYLYNLCFGEKRGWEGEGWGVGMGVGYVMPLGKRQRWRLELGLQAGYLSTHYDPFQWKCPVDPDVDTEQYYYKWYGKAQDFKKRQYLFTWLGPTRIEISLSYDLLFRCNTKRGCSFKKYGN